MPSPGEKGGWFASTDLAPRLGGTVATRTTCAPFEPANSLCYASRGERLDGGCVDRGRLVGALQARWTADGRCTRRPASASPGCTSATQAMVRLHGRLDMGRF